MTGPPREVRDRAAIERLARRAPQLHLYEIGDLDPFFWPHTRWWGEPDRAGDLRALVLMYKGADPPVLLALGRDDGGATRDLLGRLSPSLPARFYSHLGPGLVDVLEPAFDGEPHGRHLKMGLEDVRRLEGVDAPGVERLETSDLDPLLALYARSYPGSWFDPRMLQTGHYFGIREGGRLVSVAGVHVYSAEYRVAALGNITTDPAHRGRGLARRTTARLCRTLLASVDTIGLNVREDNAPAIACYEGLGFTTVAPYEEHMWTARAGPGRPAKRA